MKILSLAGLALLAGGLFGCASIPTAPVACAAPGGSCYAGPGGPLYAGPGGAMYAGPGGPRYAGPGGACYAGPGGACNAAPGGVGTCPAICAAPGSGPPL